MCMKTKRLIKCAECEIELPSSKLDFASNLCQDCITDLFYDISIDWEKMRNELKDTE
jgi:hypothetical protein